MIEILSDNIVSPLGTTSEENYLNVKAGNTGIRTYDSIFGINHQVSCSKIDDTLIDDEFASVVGNEPNYTRLEKLMLVSATKAIDKAGIDVSRDNVRFYLSTTKGNVGLLDEGKYNDEKLFLGNTANLLSNHFNNKLRPTIVSNACISGVGAIITACREIVSGRIDYAVVTGVDVLSRFVVAGFSSLMALSIEPCRPFDIERNGLNLGEAAATIVLGRADKNSKNVKFLNGSIRNDAYHISGPSRTAEGAVNALTDILKDFDKEQIAFVNTHGTATIFNDEMESIAIERLGISHKPINAFKGYYGHTLGAAGVLEVVLSKHSILDNTVLKTFGYQRLGTSRKIMPTSENIITDKCYFVKLISGFGGTNAAALFKKEV
jgi:3-oxoacyl-[acyl-carrier-protein] synthase-1